MKILTVVGARPQFIKAAAASRVLRTAHKEYILHTGQHYDANLSDIFFSELSIPAPDCYLGVGSGSHAKQTAAMLVGVEDAILREKPDVVLLYGDTNSTLAGALAASKLNVPIAHVEAGVRTGMRDMPEEQNRIVTDHLAKWNFASSSRGVDSLAQEGIVQNVYNSGDVMIDALLHFGALCEQNDRAFYEARLHFWGEKKSLPEKWILATIHRPENTDTPEKYKQILSAFEDLPYPVVYPVHPRTKKLLVDSKAVKSYSNILLVDPLGYLDMLYFTKRAQKVITDSGGLQKECYMFHVPGIIILRSFSWEETGIGGWNVLAKAEKNDILEKYRFPRPDNSTWLPYYGDGTAAEVISGTLSEQ